MRTHTYLFTLSLLAFTLLFGCDSGGGMDEPDNDEPATVQFTVSDMERIELDDPVPNGIAVSINGDVDEEVSVDIAFDTANSTAGSDDFEGSFPRTVTFTPESSSGDEKT